jgi:hypothetical protein
MAAPTWPWKRCDQSRCPQFQQENFSEYHLYTLGRRTCRRQKPQIVFAGTGVPVKNLRRQRTKLLLPQSPEPRSPIKDAVMVITFKNDEKGWPRHSIPAGNVRVYQKDLGRHSSSARSHRSHAQGEHFCSHRNAFDVVSERKQTDLRASLQTFEMEFEITLRNHKDVAITVQVNEPIGGDWEMLNSSYKYTKTSAWAAQFNVPVDKNGTSILRYRIRAHW